MRIEKQPISGTDTALTQAQSALASGNGERAAQVLQEALTTQPEQPSLYVGLGVALRFTGKFDEAATAFERALALQPTHAQAAVYLSMIRLAQGRQSEGWPLYEARWRSPHWPEKMRYPMEARWQGFVAPLTKGQRLLLWGEQGFGDVIQFARYVPWLAQQLQAQGANLVVEVPTPLHRLLQNTWPALTIAPQGQLRGHFDAHLPMMDLPRLWGNCVGEQGLPYLPEPLPYLRATPRTDTSTNLRVGIAWQGRPTHPDDKWRSIAVSALDVLKDVPSIQWVSLQRDTAQPAWLQGGIENCADFADTASLVNTLDLVISIDSAVAHLAAALGRPVWLLLPPIADWRWGLEDSDTPWYPGMRLIRQAGDEDWSAVLRRVVQTLTSARPV